MNVSPLLQDRFEDDFSNNLMLRNKFRAEKKELEAIEKEKAKPKNFALTLVEPR